MMFLVSLAAVYECFLFGISRFLVLLRPPFTGASIQGFALRLTSPFNLPAPGRRQTLYVVFDLAEPCVFSKQSPEPLNCNSFPLRDARSLTVMEHPFSRSYGVILPSS